MTDREKVIKGLKYCEEYFNCCDKCPYWDGGTHCTSDLAHDALALLKEKRPTGQWDYGTQCSVCKGTIIPPKDRNVRINFCPWCGADMRGGYDE